MRKSSRPKLVKEIDSGSESDSEEETSSSSEEFFDAQELAGTLRINTRRPTDVPSERIDLSKIPPLEDVEDERDSILNNSKLNSFFTPPSSSNTSGQFPSTSLSDSPPSTRTLKSPSSDGDKSIISLTYPSDPDSDDRRRRRMEEIRKRLDIDEIEESGGVDEASLSGSQTSSVEGVYSRPSSSSHPFKVVDHDNVSLHSGSGLRPQTLRQPQDIPVAPDLVSSCEPSISTVPVAPPRRKKKLGKSGSNQSEGEFRNPPSPTVSIRSALRTEDLQRTFADKVTIVRAQDEEKTRAKCGPKALRRTESLPKDILDAFVDSGSNASTLNMAINEGQSLGEIVSNLASKEEAKDAQQATNGQFNPLMLRTKTDSGKLLSDIQILEQVTVLNLDTGERIPLSSAEDKLPRCLNPLSLHIMRLTSEYVGEKMDSDEESGGSKATSVEDDGPGGMKKKTLQLRRLIGSTVKKTVDKAKALARKEKKEDQDILSTNEDPQETIKLKAAHSHKGPYDFSNIEMVQDLSGSHSAAVWCMKFSNCGRLLASAGQDRTIRIWVLKDHLNFFQDMRRKHTVEKESPTPSQESIESYNEEMVAACLESAPKAPFVPKPLCVYVGHTADLLDIAWSRSFFLLSSSMDRTVRLWHISRRECLCCFQHIDFVTAIAFHPRDDRYFLSGSLDGKLRLWNIPDKKVALWNEVQGNELSSSDPSVLITAANFCQNGKFAVVGTYDGRCMFYHTEQLKYHTQILVQSKKKKKIKITGIEPVNDKILVTSNDSRIRIYDLRDLSLTCKYKGYVNQSSQIKATMSHDGKYVICGSENSFVYIWKTSHDYEKFSGARRDRNSYWESIKAHNDMVSCAIFAPDPDMIVKMIDASEAEKSEPEPSQASASPQSQKKVKSPSSATLKSLASSSSTGSQQYAPLGYILVTADFSGSIKVFLNRVKPKHSSLPASALA